LSRHPTTSLPVKDSTFMRSSSTMRCAVSGEQQIFIGAESEFSAAGELSVIASPYGSRDQALGSVGVIGPTRMNYQRVIPLVNFTAQVLSRVLEQG
jgi:heat-inducible transcriptional repressor